MSAPPAFLRDGKGKNAYRINSLLNVECEAKPPSNGETQPRGPTMGFGCGNVRKLSRVN
jgi:hypothetical protein